MRTDIPIDPSRYTWVEAPDDEFGVSIVKMYRVQITRPIHVGNGHVVLRTYTVWATSPRPRIPGTVSTPTQEKTES